LDIPLEAPSGENSEAEYDNDFDPLIKKIIDRLVTFFLKVLKML